MINFQEEIKNFLDERGRLKSYPSKQKRQLYALFYLASKFEQGRQYTQKEVDQLLKDWHTFDDWAMLRRDLYDRRFLNRKADCSLYWLEETQPTPASFGFD